MNKVNPYKVCRNDILLAAGFALAAVVLLVCLITGTGREAGLVVITSNGTEYGRYSVSDEQVIDIDCGFGHNRVVISDGTVRMEDADCPDKYCISRGSISKSGETIVCLPHRLVVELRTYDLRNDVDAVAE